MDTDETTAPARGAEARTIDFGGWLMRQLDRRGWTLYHFREVAGLPYASLVYKWKNNEQRPTPRYCAIIATALDLDPDVVLLAAGHRSRDELAPGVIRAELAALLNSVDEALLAATLPWFYALADHRIRDETIVKIAERLPGPNRAG
jgi:lambda repressor-like predicted transcriptional regulator